MGVLFTDEGHFSLSSTVEREDGSSDPMFDPADPSFDPSLIWERLEEEDLMDEEEEDDWVEAPVEEEEGVVSENWDDIF